MKKRFLPFSLLLVIMIFGQSVMADPTGHYVPRSKENATADAYLRSMRVNQKTGMIDPAWMIAAAKQTATETRGNGDVYWVSMGPDNMGGRTTSIVYDQENMNHVYIGSMGGGVFQTWNKGISWKKLGDNLMVSCMVQAENGTIYVGTGDGCTAPDFNGLSDLYYSDGFVGSGLYKINTNNVMSRIESTIPSAQDTVGEWAFINDIAVVGNTVIVATSDGLRYSSNETDWNYAKVKVEPAEEKDDEYVELTGNALEVKVVSNDTILASVDGKLYIGKLNEMTCYSTDGTSEEIDSLGVMHKIAMVSGGILDVAVAPTNSNVIYAATISASTGNHVKFYATEDRGASWRIILPTPSANLGHQVYEKKGMFNHGLVVDPTNPDCFYVCGYNIWRMNRPTTQVNGYYLAVKISEASAIHSGINAFAFDPRYTNTQAYVATDGGIYKAKSSGEYYDYTNCNRGYITTRCFNVAPSGKNTRVLGGLLDHGPILIEGLEGTNNMETGELLMPGLTPAHYGVFDESYHAGFCAVSLIQPKAFFLSTNAGGIYRTETGAEDYDFSNFTADQSFTFDGYRMPMALWETFTDENSIEEVWYKCTENHEAGDMVQCFSHNAGYPFMYELPVDMHVNAEDPHHNDSILVPDPITARLYVADETNLYFSNNPLQFSSVTSWYSIAEIGSSYGMPTCISVSADGDAVLVGTADGYIIRVTGMNNPVHPDSADFAPVADVLTVSDQCITSVSFLAEDANKVVVTLGNYGNENYVLFTDDMLSEEPTFAPKQGTLPLMPVYSSVYTCYEDKDARVKEYHVLIGTEHGVYRTTNIEAANPVWTLESANMGDVPVMELKQQIVQQDVQHVTKIIDSVAVTVDYPGTDNMGVIYAATYGRGLFRCETYHIQYSNTNVSDNTVTAAKSNVTMYPNPVNGDEATISFKLNADASVSYEVYDMTGRRVKAETLGRYGEGSHETKVKVDGLSNGAYILRLNAGTKTSCVKFMVF